MNLFETKGQEFDDFSLVYEEGKIYYYDKDHGVATSKPLIETKYPIRMKVGKVLPDFARFMVKSHKARLKNENNQP